MCLTWLTALCAAAASPAPLLEGWFSPALALLSPLGYGPLVMALLPRYGGGMSDRRDIIAGRASGQTAEQRVIDGLPGAVKVGGRSGTGGICAASSLHWQASALADAGGGSLIAGEGGKDGRRK